MALLHTGAKCKHRQKMSGQIHLIILIQPWRYTDRGRPQAHADTDLQVDSRWQVRSLHKFAQNIQILLLLQGFVAENLLLYSSVLRLLLPRLLRMDLTSTKNAYLLFR